MSCHLDTKSYGIVEFYVFLNILTYSLNIAITIIRGRRRIN